MNKINCDIIKDLIPSYVDEICSDATKQCVEEHLETCADCRQTAMLCKNNALSSEEIDQKGLDGLKKIRDKMKFQNLVLCSIFILVVYLSIWVFAIRSNIPSFLGINGLCAVCMLANLCISTGYKRRMKLGKAEYMLSGISLAIDVYLAILFLYLFKKIQAVESLPNVGLTVFANNVYTQLIICFGFQIAFFIYLLVCTVKHDKSYSLPICINIMGVFLLIKYLYCLLLMDSVETLISAFFREASEIAAIGILGMAASVLITKYQKRKGA